MAGVFGPECRRGLDSAPRDSGYLSPLELSKSCNFTTLGFLSGFLSVPSILPRKFGDSLNHIPGLVWCTPLPLLLCFVLFSFCFMSQL